LLLPLLNFLHNNAKIVLLVLKKTIIFILYLSIIVYQQKRKHSLFKCYYLAFSSCHHNPNVDCVPSFGETKTYHYINLFFGVQNV